MKGVSDMQQFDFSFLQSGVPIVTISLTGIAFNRGARELIDNPEQVEVGFDPSSNVIAVKPRDVSSDNPYFNFGNRVKKDGWVRIGAKQFIKFLGERTGNDFQKATQFTPALLEEGGEKYLAINVEAQDSDLAYDEGQEEQ